MLWTRLKSEEDGLDKEQEIEESLKGKFIARPNILIQEMTTLIYTVYIVWMRGCQKENNTILCFCTVKCDKFV